MTKHSVELLEWTLLPDETNFVQGNARGEENLIRYALQVRNLKSSGRFITSYARIELKVCNYLANQLQIGLLYSPLSEAHPNTEVRIRKQVSEFLEFQNFDELKVNDKIAEWLKRNSNLISDKEAFSSSIEKYLIGEKFILPKHNQLIN